jgi:hypothetical protein
MIPLKPLAAVDRLCPLCGNSMETTGWAMPGMRCLAELVCRSCGTQWYGDLPAGHGLYYPALLDQATGRCYDEVGRSWFTEWLEESYAKPDLAPLEIRVEPIAPLSRPVVLNCLDGLYGHALLKLLNAQWYLDNRAERSLLVIVPTWLRWMVPDGVAEVWTVAASPARCRAWLPELGERLHDRLSAFGDVALFIAFPHPATSDFDIERFTGVAPFDTSLWQQPIVPTVTWIWREDRLWGRSIRDQARRVDALGVHLGELRPDVTFLVVGAGSTRRTLSHARDLRQSLPIDDATEHAWCAAYACSHVVVGIHGSNMLLPSAHAGSVLELLPADRVGNLAEDLLPASTEPVDTLLRHRFIADTSSPAYVAQLLVAMLTDVPLLRVRMTAAFVDHCRSAELASQVPKWHAERGRS